MLGNRRSAFLAQGSFSFFLVSKMVVSPCRGEGFGECVGVHRDVFQVANEAQVAFRVVELALRADRFHERVVDQSVGVTLPLKEEQSEDFPVPLDMEDIVKVVGWLRPFERVLQRTAEQAVYLDPCGRVQQQIFERTVDLTLRPECSDEVARFSPRERDAGPA